MFTVNAVTKSTLLAALAIGSIANAEVLGTRTQFRSANGVTESCVALNHMPGANYSKKDDEAEQKFCAIDFNDAKVAVCPKTWSTSPAAMIYDTDGLTQQQYEATRCTGKKGHEKIAKYKTSMNATTTSSTFSQSPLMYYHFSRYFQTTLFVPPAVYRTMDKDVHFARVAAHAVGVSKMNKSGWQIMRDADQNPKSYTPTDDLFTADRRQVYGTIFKDSGNPAGAELEGTEASGWGVGQNMDFQKTPGFLALASSQAMPAAAQEGVKLSIQDPLMAKAVGSSLDGVQVAFWMKELSEMTILDYIFNQQDRIMNIDFVWEFAYVDGGVVKTLKVKDDVQKKFPRSKKSQITVPAEIAAFKPILLQRTAINDNDAGGKPQYTNFTKKSQMLEKIRHLSGETYRRLIHLDQDFSSRGPLLQYLSTTFGLTQKSIDMVVANTKLASNIFRASCQAGQLKFDVNPAALMLGQSTAERVNCLNP